MVDIAKKGVLSFQPGDIIKEGWIEKESRYRKEWRKRWCVLTREYMFSFVNEKQYSSPTEQIEVSKIKTVKTDETKGKNLFKIEMIDQTFFFQAENFNMKEAWIGAIGNAMIKGSKNSNIFIAEES